MFSLKTFIHTIQEAILGANDALMDKNLEILNKYFEKDDDDGEIQQKLDDAIESANEVMNPNTKVSKQALGDALKSMKSLRDSLKQEDALDQALAQADIRPKTVILNYPTKAADGSMTVKEVHVPLITLIPVQFSKVEEVKIRTDLELNIVDDEVQVGLGKFSGQKKKGLLGKKEKDADGPGRSIGNIEITLKPQEVSDGMEQVIDAYEKILKAQLPQ